MNETLFLIPARGGSKGVPGKNIKCLGGRPLIHYTIDAARSLADDEDIVVSTDCAKIRRICEDVELSLPFMRPDELATDSAGSHEVIVHAIQAMEALGRNYDRVAMLQPTSPFRTGKHLEEAIRLFDGNCELLTSVKLPEDNPYYNQFQEDENGFLVPIIERTGNRRQDTPAVYTYNGAIYIMRVASIKRTHLHQLAPIRKYLMSDLDSFQIDTPFDWMVAETVCKYRADRDRCHRN